MKQQNVKFLCSEVGSTNGEKGFAKGSPAEKTMGRELDGAGELGGKSEGRHVVSENESKRTG